MTSKSRKSTSRKGNNGEAPVDQTSSEDSDHIESVSQEQSGESTIASSQASEVIELEIVGDSVESEQVADTLAGHDDGPSEDDTGADPEEAHTDEFVVELDKNRGSSTNPLVWIIFLVLALSVSALGYFVYQVMLATNASKPRMEAIENQLSGTEKKVGGELAALRTLNDEVSKQLNADLDGIGRDNTEQTASISRLETQFGDLDKRQQRVDSRVAALSVNPERLLLQQLEIAVRFAGKFAETSGDAGVLVSTLQYAAHQVSQRKPSREADLQFAINRDLNAAQKSTWIDHSVQFKELDALLEDLSVLFKAEDERAKEIEIKLIAAQEAAARNDAAEASEEIESTAMETVNHWWDASLQGLWKAYEYSAEKVGSLVSVRRVDAPTEKVLDSVDRRAIRLILRSHMLAAKHALRVRAASDFEMQTEQAKSILLNTFGSNTRSALLAERLSKLAATPLAPPIPSPSTTLAALRSAQEAL